MSPPPDNEPPALPKPPAIPKIAGGSSPQPAGTKTVVSPAAPKAPAAPAAPTATAAPGALRPPPRPPSTTTMKRVTAAVPTNPATTNAAETNPAGTNPSTDAPRTSSVTPPPMEVTIKQSPASVPPKSPSIPAPPPVIQIEEESTADADLEALAKSSIEIDMSPVRGKLASSPDGEHPRRLSDEGAPPVSRRSFEDLLPASRRGDADPDIPPPTHVDAERAPGSKDPYIGTTFDHRYKIERLLGEGGMGFVYLARHKVIDKKVAVKVLRADMARDREILERFLQEARAASSIGNPHIIDISDFGDLPDGSTYFVMEFLDGKSLIQLYEKEKSKRLGADLVVRIAIQMANGLAAAHERGIIHRDLKPENIFIIQRGADKEFIKILDFGIAKVATSGDNKLTRAGAVFGTPHYMSPEQAAGAPLDHRTDIYSLGVMLYEMVSGQLPFVADNFMGILSQHMYQAATPLSKLGLDPPCPPELEAIIFKCLSKQPDDRYPDMEALAADLQRYQAGHEPEAVAQMALLADGASSDQGTDKPKRSPWLKFVAVGAVVMGATLGTMLILIGSPPPQPDPAAATSQAAPAPAPTKSVVLVDAEPRTAVAAYEGKSLSFPTNLEIEAGKPVTFEVKADGYASQTVTLDGSEKKRFVKLVALAGTAPIATDVPSTTKPQGTRPSGTGTAPTSTKPSSTGSGGGEVVDPWGGGATTKPKKPGGK